MPTHTNPLQPGNSLNIQSVLKALEVAIAKTEKAVEHLAKQRRILPDGSFDHSHDIKIADSLDDLYSAKVLYQKLRTLKSVASTGSTTEPLLESWKAWVAIFLWDGAQGAEAKIISDQIHKYGDDSLRTYFGQELNLLAKAELATNKGRLLALHNLFSSSLQTHEALIAFQTKREEGILAYQKSNLDKVRAAVKGLSSYLRTLPTKTKKYESVSSLKSKLDTQIEDYSALLERSQNTLTSYAARNVFFGASRRFVNTALLAIRGANLDQHRDHHLKVIFANIAIAITGIGLFALAIRSIYASVHPGTSYLFFAATRGAELARKVRASITAAEIPALKGADEFSQVNPLRATR